VSIDTKSIMEAILLGYGDNYISLARAWEGEGIMVYVCCSAWRHGINNEKFKGGIYNIVSFVFNFFVYFLISFIFIYLNFILYLLYIFV
jgi:hypothetical protein